MRVAGEAELHAPVEQVWEALLDPRILVRTIPGCERLEETGEHSYAMRVTAGVAAVQGRYSGSCELTELKPNESLVLKAAGSGAPGTVQATVAVTFSDSGAQRTRLTYDADAIVGGMLGGVGQRMLTSVSKRMAGEFFEAVDAALRGAEPAAADVSAPDSDGRTYVAPTAAAEGRTDLLQGMLLGAGLALAGVIVGSLLGRRRC